MSVHIQMSDVLEIRQRQPEEPADLQRLHHHAHEQCFIAQSVRTTVTVKEPVIEHGDLGVILIANRPVHIDLHKDLPVSAAVWVSDKKNSWNFVFRVSSG